MHRYWALLAAVGLLGVMVSGYFDHSVLQSRSPAPSSTELLGAAFAILYFIATLVLAPCHALLKRYRAVPGEIATGEVTIWPWRSWVVLAPLFAGDGRAKVPRPISVALIILLHWLLAWMVFILCMVSLIHLLER